MASTSNEKRNTGVLMTRKKDVSREKYSNFRDKAEEFYEGMWREFKAGGYNNCVAMAVHCAISYVDSFTVFRLGKKSSAQNHAEAINLLKECRTSKESEKSTICSKLYQLIEMKTPTEYQDRKMSKEEAERAKNLCSKIRSFLKYELQRAETFSD